MGLGQNCALISIPPNTAPRCACAWDLQCAGALEGSVGGWAKRVRRASWDTHRKAGERRNARALIVSGKERRLGVSNGEDSIGVTDADSRSRGNLHGSLSKVQRLDESTAEPLEELVCNDLSCNWLAVDEVSNDLFSRLAMRHLSFRFKRSIR